MIFCTLFNWSYFAQGVALYRSLERTRGRDGFVLYALCMDDVTTGYLLSLGLPNLRLVSLADIENDALLAVKPQRTLGEYCWTCTTPLLLYVQDLYPEGAVVTYVDADIAFYADPKSILDELGDGSIFVHEHAFASEHAGLQAASGRFNVGVTAFRKDAMGQACLRRWQSQCLDECVMDAAAGKCGDQNYLDEWPELYPGLVISANPGVGLAPWNISKYRTTVAEDIVCVDGVPAVFYHFHGLRLLRPRLRVLPTLGISGSYRLPDDALDIFYRPYAQAVWDTAIQFPHIIASLKPLPDVHPRMEDHQIMFALDGRPLPIDRNHITMADLYGFDDARPEPANTVAAR